MYFRLSPITMTVCGGRIAVAALPERIDSADGARQSVLRAVEVDGSRFAVVGADDAQVGALFGSERIANLRHFLHQFAPAELLAEVACAPSC